MTAITTALSGMLASDSALMASASNVANSMSTGGPGKAAYEPVDTVQTSTSDGGVAATYRVRTPATQLAYQPDNPDADAGGLVAAPNVDPAREAVNQITSLRTFQLNASVMRAADAMARVAVDRLA